MALKYDRKKFDRGSPDGNYLPFEPKILSDN